MKTLYLTDKEHAILVKLLDETEYLINQNRLIESAIVMALFPNAPPAYRGSTHRDWPDDALVSLRELCTQVDDETQTAEEAKDREKKQIAKERRLAKKAAREALGL